MLMMATPSRKDAEIKVPAIAPKFSKAAKRPRIATAVNATAAERAKTMVE